jgi:DNA-binding CsgD family transcriptional regulator
LPASLASIVSPREGIIVSGGTFPKRPAAAAACGRAERILPRLPLHDTTPPGFNERAYRPFLVQRLSRQFGVRSMMEVPPYRAVVGGLGFDDAVGMMARDGTFGVVATIPLAPGETRSHHDPLLYRIRRHIQSGLMSVLRRAPTTDDIVIDRGGRMLHSSGAGLDACPRDLLAAAARAYDAERRGVVADSDVDRVWRELWAGGWGVVESVDTDGKKMLLLRRDPSNPTAHALDRREKRALELLARGATYKQIAHEIGVGITRASGIVTTAIRKLGFKSRVDFLGYAGKQAP